LHFVIGQDHWVDLYAVDQIGIVADHSGELHFPNLVQLFCFLTVGEGRRLVRQLIPKSVAATRIAELRGNYTGEGWSEHATRKWPLGHTARPEIDVGRVSEMIERVAATVSSGNLVWESTKYTRFERCVIGRERTNFTSDWYFLRDGIVHSLSNLVHQSHNVFVEDTGSIQIIWSSDQMLIRLTYKFVSFAPSFDRRWQQRVAKPEGCSRERVYHCWIHAIIVAVPVERLLHFSRVQRVVVVHELSPGDHHNRPRVIVVALVGMHGPRHDPRQRQIMTGH
ncbi:hypothetical protein WN55_00537, partial [Dufourea novaeangliae]